MTANASSGTVDPAEVAAAIAADPALAEQVVAAIANTVDAKGDLLVGTADNTVARKAVGSNGKVLVADSGQSDGLKWGGLSEILYLASVGTYSEEVLTDSPALYFRECPASGTTVTDASGNSRNAFTSGAVVAGSSLLGDGYASFSFDGSGGSVQRDQNTAPEKWIDNNGRVAVFEAIVKQNRSGANTEQFGLFGSPNGAGPSISLHNLTTLYGTIRGTLGGQSLDFPATNPGNDLFHFAMRADQPNHKLQLFINGRLRGDVSFTGHNAGGYRYQFGASYLNNTPYKGQLAHVAIYHQDVSNARIRAHAHAAGLFDPFA